MEMIFSLLPTVVTALNYQDDGQPLDFSVIHEKKKKNKIFANDGKRCHL